MMTFLPERVGLYLLACCTQPRYRTAWIIGLPLSGKTTLVRQLCSVYGWHYLNYTLDSGFFDKLADHPEMYQPTDFLNDIRTLCTKDDQSILVIDEIDALLAMWSSDQRRLFATQVSRLPHLSVGLILVSNFFDETTLAPLLPDSDLPAYYNLSGAQQ